MGLITTFKSGSRTIELHESPGGITQKQTGFVSLKRDVDYVNQAGRIHTETERTGSAEVTVYRVETQDGQNFVSKLKSVGQGVYEGFNGDVFYLNSIDFGETSLLALAKNGKPTSVSGVEKKFLKPCFLEIKTYFILGFFWLLCAWIGEEFFNFSKSTEDMLLWVGSPLLFWFICHVRTTGKIQRIARILDRYIEGDSIPSEVKL